MWYLIWQIIFCLLIAAIVGGIIGWLLRSWRCKEEARTLEARWRDRLSAVERDRDQLKASGGSGTAGAGAAHLVGGAAAGVAAGTAAARPAAQPAQPAAQPKAGGRQDYPIEDIEGIGKAFGKKLRGMGIDTTMTLLDRGARSDGRREIAQGMELEEKTVLRWCSMSDMMRVPGVRSQYSELLVTAGVHSVQELRQQSAEGLAATMADKQQELGLTKTTPSVSSVVEWINAAKSIGDKLVI